MDDILLSHKDMTILQESYPFLIQILAQWGLQVAAEKVQISEVGTFLGSIISPTEKVQVAHIGAFLGSLIYPDKIVPQKLEIHRDHLYTLNDFQKLLGDINWLRPFLKISSAE